LIDAIPQNIRAALGLIQIAKGGVTQSRKVANFFLAWWNAEACGGFDLADLWEWTRPSPPRPRAASPTFAVGASPSKKLVLTKLLTKTQKPAPRGLVNS
jgi:hypothetical protein